MTQHPSAADIVAFWTAAGPAQWFAKDDAFDTDLRDRFFDAHMTAARRELDSWLDTAEGALALMILLDQFPRNAFRGTGHQFATDPLALTLAQRAVERGHHLAFEFPLRNFMLLPFEHSERLEDQDRYMDLAASDAESLKWGQIHRDIIVRFGRFPHRNRALGRDTTPEEQAFLDADGFSG